MFIKKGIVMFLSHISLCVYFYTPCFVLPFIPPEWLGLLMAPGLGSVSRGANQRR